jgi:hypothetical protein
MEKLTSWNVADGDLSGVEEIDTSGLVKATKRAEGMAKQRMRQG